MTDRLTEVLTHLDDDLPDDLPDDRPDAPPADPRRIADGALARARRRRRDRRVAAAVVTPLVAAAAAVAVALLPGSLLPGLDLRGDQPAGPTAPAREAPWGDASRVDVLLVGSDAAKDRVGWRADSVVLASIDIRTGDTLLVGVPRNRLGTRDALGRWQISPDPRTAPIEPQVEALTGQTIDATVRVDMAGFSQLVDVLGGVEVTVRQKLPIGGRRTDSGGVAEYPSDYLMPGTQKLDGRSALWFARSRFSTDDYDRMRRQRCLLGAVVRQVDAPRLLTRLPGILEFLGGHVQTTIDVRDLPAWVDLVAKVRTARVRSLVLAVPVLPDGGPDVERSAAVVADALAPPPAAAASAAPGTSSDAPSAVPWSPVDLEAAC